MDARGWWWGTALAAALAGCGDNLTLEARSGTRLKLTWYELDDGTRGWTHWRGALPDPEAYYDAKLEQGCSPQKWEDGKTYCTPPTSSVWYLDARCTQPIGHDPSFRYAAAGSWRCDHEVPSQLFRVTSTRSVDNYYFRDPAGQCKAGGRAEVTNLEPLPVATLASLDTIRVGRGNLGTLFRTSDDGLVAPAAVYDRDLGTTCYLALFDNAEHARCMPARAAYLDEATAYADAACEQAAFRAADQCVPPVAQIGSGCDGYYRVGERVNGYSYDGASCRADPARGEGMSVLGLSHVELTPLERRPDATTDRIRPIYYEGGDVRFADPDTRYDAVLDAECWIEIGADGSVRCSPYGYAVAQDAFTDAACSQVIVVVERFGGHDPCIDRAPSRYVGWAGRFYRIGDVHQGTLYKRDASSDACTPVNDERYDLGALVPDEMIAHGHVVD